MLFLLANIAFDLSNVLSFLLRNNIDTYGRKVEALTLYLFFAALETSLVILVFLINLVLIGLALISGLSTRYVSKKRISGLNLSGVLLFFLTGPIFSGTP